MEGTSVFLSLLRYQKNAMNRGWNFSLMILSVLIFETSCIRYGDWDDNIKLSVRSVGFDARGDSVVITTKGSWWWITDVSVDNNCFYEFTGVDQQSDSYVIKQDCFLLERRDKHTLFIRVEANPLNVQRIITIGFEAGDYFDRVTITQK